MLEGLGFLLPPPPLNFIVKSGRREARWATSALRHAYRHFITFRAPAFMFAMLLPSKLLISIIIAEGEDFGRYYWASKI